MLRLSENTNKLGAGQTNIEPFRHNLNPKIIEKNLIIISNQLIVISYMYDKFAIATCRLTCSESYSAICNACAENLINMINL